MFSKLFKTENDAVQTLIRLFLGVVMFPHGAQKMLGWFGGFGFSATMGFLTEKGHFPAVLAFLAIAAEFFGSLGLITGLLSRIAAFGILCNMVVAVLTVHLRVGFFMNWMGTQKGEGYEFHLLAIALGLAVLIRGAGALSLDRLIHSRLAPRS